ncbi:Eco57I restriction-modification methylase domain-containing protein [Weeksellaceae bacterium TAE3-ERU29]|nr:Eco57I restriction-modification methylase domain-containing protein [Weeksellaceae bacterium TAE3-ERU29]
MNKLNYNPDVLTCLANLSNDEVFTPPNIANQMLDTLPQELWSNPKATFLDPFTKSGVFLREIAKRLLKGLETQIPDLQERINHIMQNQIFGIGITELTSLLARRTLYCTKNANGEYSVVTGFKSENGNIHFENIPHTWENGKCTYCGANQDIYDRDDSLETHAYQFIHNKNPFKNMQFDVIIGNPPYQLNDGGGTGSSAKPLYHLFVQQAKKLRPHYLCMIIPSRWFVGGKGLDDFRDEMLNDKRMKEIHDFPNASECFPGISLEGGVNYFLWDREYRGDCLIKTYENEECISEMKRPLKEKDTDVFIRYNKAISILRKVQKFNEDSFSKIVSSRKPFGLSSTIKGNTKPYVKNENIKLYQTKGTGYIKKEDIFQNEHWINEHKVYVGKAYGMGNQPPYKVINNPIYGEPNTACTETYLLIGAFKDKNRCENVISYMETKFFRNLLLLKKSTQNTTKSTYEFIPIQNFDEEWTDEKLYKKYNLTEEEINYIESMVRPMDN